MARKLNGTKALHPPSAKGKRNYGLELQTLGRDMGIHTIMFHHAVAERLGLNITDHKCLDFILRGHSVTAGEIITKGGAVPAFNKTKRKHKRH